MNTYEPETDKQKLIQELNRKLSNEGYRVLLTMSTKLYVPKQMTMEEASVYTPGENNQMEIVATKAYKNLLYGIYEERKIAVIFTASI